MSKQSYFVCPRCGTIQDYDPRPQREGARMMLTAKERAWIGVLIRQARFDVEYMSKGWDDPGCNYTRGICSRHTEMAQFLRRVLETNEIALAADAVDPVEGVVTK